MFLVLKRFPMDDVPIGLYKNMNEVDFHIGADQDRGENYATPEQQELMQCDVGCKFYGTYLIVEFNDVGEPVNSKIVRG